MWNGYSLPFGADGFAARGHTRPRIPTFGEGKVLQSFTMELETKRVLQFFVPLRVKGPSYKQGFTTGL